jgi:hypothetical protein
MGIAKIVSDIDPVNFTDSPLSACLTHKKMKQRAIIIVGTSE